VAVHGVRYSGWWEIVSESIIAALHKERKTQNGFTRQSSRKNKIVCQVISLYIPTSTMISTMPAYVLSSMLNELTSSSLPLRKKSTNICNPLIKNNDLYHLNLPTRLLPHRLPQHHQQPLCNYSPNIFKTTLFNSQLSSKYQNLSKCKKNKTNT
jgi:hypothetical protein